MALSDLAIYSEYTYTSMTEVITQQIDIFNAASRNTIMLQSSSHQGDYSEKAFYAKIAGLVRRRNPYGSGAVSHKKLSHLTETMVKVAAGTPPVDIDPGQFKWIQQNPEVAGAAMGKQLAMDMLADMLNTGIGAGYAALGQVSALVYDATSLTPATLTPPHLNSAASLFGDRSADIAAWILHSVEMHALWGSNLANGANLFKWGTVSVVEDMAGRIFVMTDAPGLVISGSPNNYITLGLVPGAIQVDQNDDYTDNIQTNNGDENIGRTFQAEWSYQLGVKGFTWDKTNGGHAPNDAAINTATNWDKVATSNKDLAGVVVKNK